MMATLETIIDSPRRASTGAGRERCTIADAIQSAEDIAVSNLELKMVAEGRISGSGETKDALHLMDNTAVLTIDDLRELLDDPNAEFIDVDNTSLPATVFSPMEITTRALQSKNLLPHHYDLDLIVARCFDFSNALGRNVCKVSMDEFWEIVSESNLRLEDKEALVANAVAAQSQVVKAQEDVAELISLRYQALSAATNGGVSMRQLGKELGLTHQGVSKMLKAGQTN